MGKSDALMLIMWWPMRRSRWLPSKGSPGLNLKLSSGPLMIYFVSQNAIVLALDKDNASVWTVGYVMCSCTVLITSAVAVRRHGVWTVIMSDCDVLCNHCWCCLFTTPGVCYSVFASNSAVMEIWVEYELDHWRRSVWLAWTPILLVYEVV